MFVYGPALILQGSWIEILWSVVTGVVGTMVLAAAVQGWLLVRAGWIQRGLLLAEGRKIQLSPAAIPRAQQVVRRHRLTEVLLHNVLEVSEESMESTACQVEHLLNEEVTEAVCTFLGHPPSCPHGRQVPGGRCCEAALATVQPLIVPLERCRIGEKATVALIHSQRHTYLRQLSAMGVAPGSHIRLLQTHPALVVRVGETELALDLQAGREILVRR